MNKIKTPNNSSTSATAGPAMQGVDLMQGPYNIIKRKLNNLIILIAPPDSRHFKAGFQKKPPPVADDE